MKLIKAYIVPLLCLISVLLQAQGFEQYDASKGLPSDHVYRITQDSLGYIWAITDKGVARFDGDRFKVFTTRDGLPKNDIWDIRLGADDKKWYFTKSGELGYILNDAVVNYPACDPETVLYPASIFQDGDRFAIGNNQQAYVRTDSCWKAVPYHFEIEDPLARLYHFKNELFGPLDYSIYRGIRYQSIDSLAMAMHHSGYIIHNLNSNTHVEGRFPPGLIVDEPRFNRFHWFNGGMQLTGKNFVMQLGPTLEQLPPVQIDSSWNSHFTMIDRSGNLWCATFDRGILMVPSARRFNRQLLQGQTVKSLKELGEQIVALVEDKGYYRLPGQGSDLQEWVPTSDLLFDAVVGPEQDRFYLLTDQWVRVVDNQGDIIQQVPNKAIGLRSLVWYQDSLLAFSPGGIQQLDPQSLQQIHSIPQFGVRGMVVMGNDLYVGTSGGLKRLQGDQLQAIALENTLIQKPVLCLTAMQDGRLLVGTDGFGSYQLDPSEQKVTTLPGTEFSSVVELSLTGEDLLLATEAGLLHYRLGAETWKISQRYGRKHGLSTRAVNDGVIWGEEVLIASDEGITMADRDQQRASGTLAIDLRKLSFNGEGISAAQQLEYSGNNQLSVGVGLIDFTPDRGEQHFQYRLLPVQQRWLDGSGNNITFNDLKPGNYILEVQNDGLKAQTTWVITPLWWQSWWGRSLMMSLGLLMIVGIFWSIRRYELKRKLNRLEIQSTLTEFELYALRSQMNPHFVFNSLAAIQHCINKQDLKTAEAYLVKFSKLVRQFFELSKEESVAVTREAALLESYLEIEKLRFGDRLNYQVVVDPALQNGQGSIPTMLLQPVVENAVNHGLFNKDSAGKVSVQFIAAEEGMEVYITDDGVGYAKTLSKQRVGRRSTQVLEDRIFFLNKSGKWRIEKSTKPAYPERTDQGSMTTFNIQSLS